MRPTMRIAATTVVVGLALAACSTDKGTEPTSAAKAEAPAFRMTAGGGPTFPRNFNIFAPASVTRSPGSVLFYEPLLANDRSKAGAYQPWLAAEHAWSDGGKTITFTLREDVKWSDGKAFTSADVKFTFDLMEAKPWASVEAPDPKTVVVRYEQSSYADLAAFASASRRIVPQHIWSQQDAKTWTNPDPVGTGPFTVTGFSPQQITLKMRSDYWGGPGKGINEVKIMSSGEEGSIHARLKAGDLDWATVGWPGVSKEFVGLDPAKNLFNFYNTGGSDGILFNTTKPPFNDVHVRRALRDSVDLAGAAKIVDVGYAAPNVLGLEPSMYADLLKPEYAQPHAPDVAKAKAELAAGGWTVEGGNLVKDGKSYPVNYAVYQPYAEWVSTGQLLADQWQNNLGIKVTVKQMGDEPFTAAETKGDFLMASDSPAWGGSFYSAFSGYAKDSVTPLGEDASSNYGRWDHPEFQGLLEELKGLDPAETARITQIAQQMQDIVYTEAPFLATATAGWKAQFVTTNWTGQPQPGDSFVPNGTLAPDAIRTLLNLTPKQ